MTFLAPAAFLFALVLPVVLAMYLLKRRRTYRPRCDGWAAMCTCKVCA
jgi:hypothetical protein